MIKYELDINVHNFENWLFSTVGSVQKQLAQLFNVGNHIEIIRI